MIIEPGPGEPPAGPWQVVELTDLAAGILAGSSQPYVVAVDGRSGGGKSTFATRLAGAVPHSTIIHIDDVAWHAPMFGWTDLLTEGVLGPVRRGDAVSYRPPAWDIHDRPGAIDVPAGLDLVLVEGGELAPAGASSPM